MVVALVALVSSLTGGAIAATVITSKQVKNGSLLAKDFKKGQLPKTAVKMGRGGSGNLTLLNSTEEKQVATVSIKAPAKGFVWLNYGATIDNKTPSTWLNVFLMEGRKRLNGVEWWEPGDADGNYDDTQTNQVVVPVKKGRHTYSLRLRMSAGTGGAHDARITALFVPSSL
jgi:hypothetical protein